MKLRKLLILAIAAAMVVSLTACSKTSGGSSSDEDTSSSQDASDSKKDKKKNKDKDKDNDSKKDDDDDSKKDDDDDTKKDDEDSRLKEKIVGSWDCDEREVSMVLDADGRFTLTDVETTVLGSYKVDGRKITLVADEYEDEPVIWRYDSSDDIITLSDDDEEFEFRKVRKPSYVPDEEEKPINNRSPILGDWYCAGQDVNLTIWADGTFSSSSGGVDLEGTYEIDGMDIVLEANGVFEYGTYYPDTDELAFEPSYALFTRK